MLNRKIITLALIIIIAFMVPVEAARTPSVTTIPPITAQSAGVYFQCNPFTAQPGSVTPGSSGFILVSCGSVGGAMFLDGTLTPSFQLGLGYSQAAIVIHRSSTCNYKFQSLPIIGSNVTYPSGSLLNRTMTFSFTPSQGQMISQVYDYCLQYTNAPPTGLAGFTITWT